MSQRSQNEYVNNSKYYLYMVTISTLYYDYDDCFTQILLMLSILLIYALYISMHVYTHHSCC